MLTKNRISLVLLLLACVVNCQNQLPTGFIQQARLGRLFENSPIDAEAIFRALGPILLTNPQIELLIDPLNGLNVSDKCKNRSLEFLGGLSSNQSAPNWATQVIDAWGKPPSGVFRGGSNWVGEYKQCKDIIKSSKTWKSKYCVVNVGGVLSKYGICISDDCSENDMANMVNFVIYQVGNILSANMTGYIDPRQIECKTESTSMYASSIVVWVIVSLIGAFVLLATALDEYNDYKMAKVTQSNVSPTVPLEMSNSAEAKPDLAKELHRNRKVGNTMASFLATFSIFKNARKIFHISNTPNSDQFDCLNGLRVLSITWVILGHTYLESLGVANNIVDALEWAGQTWFLLIANAGFSVDTFFVMSGFLLAFLFLRETKKTQINAVFMAKYYFHRWWRLTPLYLMVTLMSAFLTPYMGEGPFYKKDGVEPDMCRNTWWLSIVYLNNFISVDKLCLGVTWYLSNAIPLASTTHPNTTGKKKTNHWYRRCSGFFLVNIIGLSLLINSDKEAYSFGTANPNTTLSGQAFMDVYVKPYFRIAPFVIGVLFGFFLFEMKERKVQMKLNFFVNMTCWAITLGMGLLMIFGNYPDYRNAATGLSFTERNLYQTFSRSIWSLCICYIIFACVTSQGGWVNSILSQKFWIPLSRMSYAVYLVHMSLIRVMFARNWHAIYLQNDLIIYTFVAHWVVSYLLAFFLNIFIESPFIGLEKFMFKRK